MSWHWLWYWTVLAKGMRDGRRGLPRESHSRAHHAVQGDDGQGIGAAQETQPNLSFYESQVLDITEINTAKTYESWRRRKEPLDGRCKALRWEFTRILEQLQKCLVDHRAKEFRDVFTALGAVAYWLVMALVGGAEVSFNGSAFRVLRVPDGEAYILALGPSVLVLLAAHLIGRTLRHWLKGDDRTTTAILAAFLAVCMLVMSAVSVTTLRGEYLLAEHSVSTPHAVTALAMVNTVFLIGGVIAAYLRHDADPELERIVAQRRRLTSALRRTWRKWNKASASYDTARAVTREKVIAIREEARAKIDEYRRGVAVAAPSGHVPSWFAEPLEESLFRPFEPDLLTELDGPPPSIDELLEETESSASDAGAVTGNGRTGAPRPWRQRPARDASHATDTRALEA